VIPSASRPCTSVGETMVRASVARRHSSSICMIPTKCCSLTAGSSSEIGLMMHCMHGSMLFFWNLQGECTLRRRWRLWRMIVNALRFSHQDTCTPANLVSTLTPPPPPLPLLSLAWSAEGNNSFSSTCIL
jgi:hypothetical protein